MFDKTMVRGLLTVAFVATLLGGSAHGSLIAYDGFAYPVGSSLAGQNGGQGFSGAWYEGGYNVSEALTTVGSGSLTYPLLATTGNELTTPATSYLNGVARNLFSPISSGTVYLSCLLCPEGTLGQGNGGGFFGIYLHGSLNDLFMGTGSALPYSISLRGGADSVLSTSPEVVGQTEFLVLKAQLQPSGNDVFTLYTDPTPGAAQPSTGTVINNVGIGTLSSLVIYSGGAFSMGALRVGTTYADVTPPATSWAAAVSGSWSNTGNWTGGVPNAIGAGAAINVSTTAALTITLDAPQTLGALLLGNSGAAGVGYTLNGAGSNTLTLNNSGNGATITVTDGKHAINAPLVLNDNLTVNNSASLTLDGVIANGANGPMGITVSGGLLALAAGNTYSGNTTISGGTVTLAHPLAVQNSTVNVTNSGTLSFAAGNISPTLGGLAGAGNIALATAAAEPVTLNVGNNGQNTTYGGILRGAGGLTKQGPGSLTLTAPSTYSGPTLISGGVLATLGPQPSIAAKTATGVASGSGASYDGSLGYDFTTTVPIYITELGAWDNGYATSVPLNVSHMVSIDTTGGSPLASFTVGTTSPLNGEYRFATLTTPYLLSPGTYEIWSDHFAADDYPRNCSSGVDAGVTGVTFASNSFYGSDGSMPTNSDSVVYRPVSFAFSTSVANNLLPNTPLMIAAGSTFDLGGENQAVASLGDNGSGGSVINSSSAASVLTLSPTGGSTTFSGMIQGGGTLGAIRLVMSGSGTQVLAGSSTYTGPTTINGGKLVVNGSLASAVTVQSGGTLGGTGHLSSGTVSTGGYIAPGNLPQGLSFSGGLLLASGAEMDYALDTPSTSDEIACGSLIVGSPIGFSNFDFTWTANFAPGTYNLIEAGSLPIGSLGNSTSGTIDGYSATLAVQRNDIVLNVVPEPGTLALLGAGALGLLGYGWRRRRAARTAKPAAFDRPHAPAILSFPSRSSPASAARRAA